MRSAEKPRGVEVSSSPVGCWREKTAEEEAGVSWGGFAATKPAGRAALL